MANIDMTPEMSEALRHRLTREYADVCVTNFAQDILIEALQIEVQKLRDHVAALQERCAKQDATIEQQAIDLGGRGSVQRKKLMETKRKEFDEPNSD